MTNSKVANELNEVMGKRNRVWIYCNGNNNLVIRGSRKSVEKSVEELCLFGLTLIKFEEPDSANPYSDGKYSAEVGKIA